MTFVDLVNIAERFMEIVNPLTPEKVLRVGTYLRLGPDSRIIDFGCGYAEPLVLLAEHFGSSGIGIDIRKHACERAERKVTERGLADRLKIVCARGAEYPFEEHAFDAAVCVGASFIWLGFEPALRALARAVRPQGRVAIGEPYWLSADVPAEYAATMPDVHTERELLEIIRRTGFELEYVVRSSQDDWDSYEAGNWQGLVRWLEENPHHPERNEVHERLHEIQDEYLTFGRQYLGWAVYVLAAGSV